MKILNLKSVTCAMLFFLVMNTQAQAGSGSTTCDTIKWGPSNSVNAGILSSAPTATQASNISLFLAAQWTYGGNPGESRTLFRLALSGIPQGSVVTSAYLNLYADTNSTADGIDGQPMYGSADSSYLLQITSPWNDSTVTWNTQPTTTTAGEVLLHQSTSPTENYLGLDITPFVRTWVDSPSLNYGIMLQIITPNHYNTMIFCSGDYPDSTLWPTLDICYTPPTGITPINASEDNGMSVYPNPNNGHLLNVKLPDNMDITSSKVVVYDMLSREIPFSLLEQKIGQFVISLDDDTPSGIYLVGIKNQGQEVFRKIFISK